MSDRNNMVSRIDDLLTEALCLIPVCSKEYEAKLQRRFNSICELLFKDDFFQDIWDERILLHIESLFTTMKPSDEVYGAALEVLASRTKIVKEINDIFFAILDDSMSIDQIAKMISIFIRENGLGQTRLEYSIDIEGIRAVFDRASDKISAFLEKLGNEDDLLGTNTMEFFNKCLEALKFRESPGRVNAILVNSKNDRGIIVPLEIYVAYGGGDLVALVSAGEHFTKAVQRAQRNVIQRGYLGSNDDVSFTLGITNASLVGESLALPAAVAMCLAKSGRIVDPYTAFTGNINLEKGEWNIKGVSSIGRKIDAAVRGGCRRVFLPNENRTDIDNLKDTGMRTMLVSDILEVLIKLQPGMKPVVGETLQVRRLNTLRALCEQNGWYLSEPIPVQNGLRFNIIPIDMKELSIILYDTGKYAPKDSKEEKYQEILSEIEAVGTPKVPIQKIERTLNISDHSLQDEIEKCLLSLKPSEEREEKYCRFSLRFERNNEKLVIKQYDNGKLHFQGRAAELYNDIVEAVVNIYNLKYPQAKLDISDYVIKEERSVPETKDIRRTGLQKIAIPHIGTDESGKGDYFGPLVVAAVWVDEKIQSKLDTLGVKDSKKLSDNRCRELAAEIRKLCRGKYIVVEIPPHRYNELYREFKSEGKNLNHLLAWGHARAIESLLRVSSCNQVIADQFGDETFIESKLMEKGKSVSLYQTPKGERYTAIAAASVLARDRFIETLEILGKQYGIVLPKGSSTITVTTAQDLVSNNGVGVLERVAKVHHRTTEKVLKAEDA